MVRRGSPAAPVQSSAFRAATHGREHALTTSFERGKSVWRLVRAAFRRQRVRLTLALRVTIAAALALAIAQWLGLPLPPWAVLTAMVVTQVNVGRTLKSVIDYLSGTLGGALWGGAIAM